MQQSTFSVPMRHIRRLNRQRGATTLLVVMVLFFVMSLAAAYASRNLVFEQRTSANQYRSTQSFEAADAGVEWAVAMLNSGRIDDSCDPTTNVAKLNFRERYLTTNTTTGFILPKFTPTGGDLWAACTLDGTTWRCVCPSTALTASSLPVVGPAFAVRFVEEVGAPGMTDKPGIVRVEVNGCSSYDVACLQGSAVSFGSCQATMCSLLALHSGAKTPPVAAITARGNIAGSGLAASNVSRNAGGITLHTGGTVVVGTLALTSVPGKPGQESVRASAGSFGGLDAADTASCTYCMFSSVFGLRPATYREQGGALTLDCSTACTAAAVNAALASARGRIVVLRNAGGLLLNSGGDIGTNIDPVVLVVEGPLTIDAGATGARIFGLVYAAGASIDAGEIKGALVSSAGVQANGTASVVYEESLLSQLQLTSGSFVRIAGGWRDFP